MRPSPKIKKLYFTLKVLIPGLQFITLLAILFIVSRCSPLSPSTDKGGLPISQGTINAAQTANSNNGKINTVIQENLLQNLLEEINSASIEKLSEKDFELKNSETISLSPTTAVSEKEINDAFNKKNALLNSWSDNQALLSVFLTREQQDSFYRDGFLRLDLYSLMSHDTNKSSQQNLFKKLQKELKNKNLGAKTYMLFSDKNTALSHSSTDIQAKISLAFQEERKLAVLEFRRENADINMPSFEAMIRDARQIVIVLE